MKKILITIISIAVLLLAFTACQPRYVIVPIPGGTTTPSGSEDNEISTFAALKNALENGTDGKYILNKVPIDPETDELPIKIKGSKEITGSVKVRGTISAFSMSADSPALMANETGIVIFEIQDESTATFNAFSAEIDETSAEKVEAVISVDNGKIIADNITITTSGDTAVTGIAIGENTDSDNIAISNTNAVISIDENNTKVIEISAAIGESNSSSSGSSEIKTGYEVTDKESFEAMLANKGKARLTQDISIEDNDHAYILPTTVSKTYDIDLNGYRLDIKSKGCFYIQTGTSATFRNGKLYVERTDDVPQDRENEAAELGLYSNASLILDNVDFESKRTGILIRYYESDISVTIRNNSTVTAGGSYGISTNADVNKENGAVSKNIMITVEDSIVESKFATGIGSTGIMLNVPGTLTVRNSTIKGTRNGVTLRGGTAIISDNSHIISGEFDDSKISDKYIKENWGTDVQAPYAALLVGNRTNNSYKYSTECTVTDSEIINNSESSYASNVYVASSNEQNVTFISQDYAAEAVAGNHYYQEEGSLLIIKTRDAGANLVPQTE